MKLLETARQHANRTARHARSIFDRARVGTGFVKPQYKHTRENARRRRQIERGVLKVG